MFGNPIGKPFIVTLHENGRPGKTRALRRQSLAEGIDEAWLQELLEAEPALLPVTDIDERIQEPLISLGCEIGTSAGPIDNLFISKNGYLVVVETKLWRNSEARRKVVAQILDYATHLRRWDYGKLQDEWRKQTKSEGSLWEHVRPEDWDEPEWIDRVNDNLSAGRMVLLIVGDGIRSRASMLAEAMSGHPDFQFRLGMVELRLYEVSDGQIMAIPTTLARTREIERAIVRIEQKTEADVAVTVETPLKAVEKKRTVSVLTEEAFLAELRRSTAKGTQNAAVVDRLLKLLQDTDLMINWQRASFSVKYPDPSESGTMFSLAYAYENGGFGCWSGVLRSQLVKAFGETDSATRLADVHVSRLRELGATGKKDVGVELALLEGKEGKIIDWLEATVAAIREEANKSSRQED